MTVETPLKPTGNIPHDKNIPFGSQLRGYLPHFPHGNFHPECKRAAFTFTVPSLRIGKRVLFLVKAFIVFSFVKS